MLHKGIRPLVMTRSKNSVHPKYMYFIYDSKRIAMYARCAACLVYLYKGLHAASRKGNTFVNDCVTLLQIWTYERFLVGRPNPRPDSLLWLPRARAWAYSARHQYPNRRDSPITIYLSIEENLIDSLGGK